MRCKHLCLNSLLFNEYSQRLAVDYRCNHSHLVSLDTVKAFLHTAHPAEDVSSSYNYSDLYSNPYGLCYLYGVRFDYV